MKAPEKKKAADKSAAGSAEGHVLQTGEGRPTRKKDQQASPVRIQVKLLRNATVNERERKKNDIVTVTIKEHEQMRTIGTAL